MIKQNKDSKVSLVIGPSSFLEQVLDLYQNISDDGNWGM